MAEILRGRIVWLEGGRSQGDNIFFVNPQTQAATSFTRNYRAAAPQSGGRPRPRDNGRRYGAGRRRQSRGKRKHLIPTVLHLAFRPSGFRLFGVPEIHRFSRRICRMAPFKTRRHVRPKLYRR